MNINGDVIRFRSDCRWSVCCLRFKENGTSCTKSAGSRVEQFSFHKVLVGTCFSFDWKKNQHQCYDWYSFVWMSVFCFSFPTFFFSFFWHNTFPMLLLLLGISEGYFLLFLLFKPPSFLTLFPFLLCRVEAVGYQRVLQVDLEVNGLMVTQGSREVTWQVEYPLTRTLTSEVQTLIRLAPQDLGGIVPLAMVRNEALATDFCASLRIF